MKIVQVFYWSYLCIKPVVGFVNEEVAVVITSDPAVRAISCRHWRRERFGWRKYSRVLEAQMNTKQT